MMSPSWTSKEELSAASGLWGQMQGYQAGNHACCDLFEFKLFSIMVEI